MKQFAITLAFVGLVDLSGVLVAAQARCTFPGENRRCVSPRGHWEVEWRERSGDARHVLWLHAIAGGTPKKLLEFDRSADLLWSPEGRALAVTDHAGSSESALWVFIAPSFLAPVNVADRLRANLGALPEIFTNGHRYLEAVTWLSAE